MCTVIAIRNPNPGYEFFFFVSRDRPADPFFGNYLKFFPKTKVIGIYDVRSKGLACGYCFESGIYAAVANVGDYLGVKSRGILIKDILTVKNIQNAIRRAEKELVSARYSSGSYLIGQRGMNWLLENYGNIVYSERLDERFIVTNYFTGLKSKAAEEAKMRRDYVRKELSRLSTVGIRDILRIIVHHSSRDGICRHGITLASLLVAGKKSGAPEVLFKIGESCQGLHSVSDVYPNLR